MLMTDEEIVIEAYTMKQFMEELRINKAAGVADEVAYTSEEVRQVVVDLLNKLTWIAVASDVRRPMAPLGGWDQEDFFDSGFNEGLDKYQAIIIDTKTAVEALA